MIAFVTQSVLLYQTITLDTWAHLHSDTTSRKENTLQNNKQKQTEQ